MAGVERGVGDAVVIREAGEEDASELSLFQVPAQPRGGSAVVLEEGGIGIDFAVEAFAKDQFGAREGERGVVLRTFTALNAVVGPKGLRAVAEVDLFEGLLARVDGGERFVVGGVPVLGEDDVLERAGLCDGLPGLRRRHRQRQARHRGRNHSARQQREGHPEE